LTECSLRFIIKEEHKEVQIWTDRME